MLTTITSLVPLMVLMPIISIAISSKHLLMCLLNLEASMLFMLTLMFLSNFMMTQMDNVNFIAILTLSACEASMGLTCMVLMLRTYGNDNLKMSPMIKC